MPATRTMVRERKIPDHSKFGGSTPACGTTLLPFQLWWICVSVLSQ